MGVLRVLIKFGIGAWGYPSVRSHVCVAGGVGLVEEFGRMLGRAVNSGWVGGL